MKRLCLASVLLLFIGCERNGIFPENTSIEDSTENYNRGSSAKISYTEALESALQGIAMLESSPATRSETSRSIDPTKVEYRIVSATRNGSGPDTLMYVFNFTDSAGFAIIAADRRADRLLAVTEKGCYIPGEPTGNPGFDWYMQCIEAYLNNPPETRTITPSAPDNRISKIKTSRSISIRKGPFLTVKWGQKAPYNMYCPVYNGQQCVAGCVAVAIAQIMTYYAYPSEISLTYKEADVSSQILDWTAMKRHVRTETCNANDCTAHAAIGYLVREIGEQVYMNYGISASGADFGYVRNCFSHFGYTSAQQAAYKFDSIISSLNKAKLVCMKGSSKNNGKTESHAWIIDGYQTITERSEIWSAPNENGPWTFEDVHFSDYNYSHCNWGWNGLYDGYYSQDVFNITAPYELDPLTGSSILKDHDYNFNLSLQMITNISPNL
ncbi:MAG: C10 family peptidase [Alistipes sp.]|nr:C10 family peptidase [Alistipes sp.]